MDMSSFHSVRRQTAGVPIHPRPPAGPARLHALLENLADSGADADDSVAALVPRLAAALDTVDDPEAALTWLDSLFCRVGVGEWLLTTLAASPGYIATLVALKERSPRLAAMLAADPGLIRAWLAARQPFRRLTRTLAAWPRRGAALPPAETMGQVARDTHDCRFALEIHALQGSIDAFALARANTALANGAVATAHRLALAELSEKHGHVQGSELVVLAMGRYGGGELTAQSHLDLVFLFTGDGSAMSDGRRPIDAAELFDRAAVLITRHLATHSVHGPLYEVDTRLRPWGDKGPRACSLTCLDRYLGENAGTWEFMAMTRARPVIGSASARAAIADLLARHDATVRARAVIDDARVMRMTIARHKPPRGTLDVKLVHGGLVDLEFAVHINQLRHGIGCLPGLGAAIAMQIEAGLADPALAEAHRLLTALLIALRLAGAPADEQRLTEPQAAQVARVAGSADWTELMDRYRSARQIVQRALRNTLSQPGR